jgi:hypothetical protein
MRLTIDESSIIIKPENSEFYLSISVAKFEDGNASPDFYMSIPVKTAVELRDKLNKVLEDVMQTAGESPAR